MIGDTPRYEQKTCHGLTQEQSTASCLTNVILAIYVCVCVYVWVCFNGISKALPMFSYLWGNFFFISHLVIVCFFFFFYHKRVMTACIYLLKIPWYFSFVRVCIWKLTLSLCEWFFLKRNSVNILLMFGYRCTCTWVNVVMSLCCLVFTSSLFCKLTR